ncbi:Protein-glutamine gamma-glutamyltransferase [Planctomycetes bacterium Pan216]|uniref:Protein-glutamine gamma-glutamyltransferase n=1 Tax=Kolteria novifilia TaxID=2527975 RepID=A0A518AXL8_9BACT|nr:Protein-glutamine gamma-glutamyltransferase [Planctomycetes bacterium Pan216]
MDPRRLHLIVTYLMLCLGTTALWMGEAEYVFPYPILVVVCAIVAYIWVDGKRLTRMSTRLANILGLIIMTLIGVEVVQGVVSAVTALAHFLVYLQVAMFFREKSTDELWRLYGLNLLQVVIGCVLSQSPLFGMLLLAYLLLAVLSLGLFQLVRHQDRLGPEMLGKRVRVPRLAFSGVLRRLSLLFLASIPLGLAIFFFVPRGGAMFHVTTIDASSASSLRTGFSHTVSLDEMSRILESDDIVFEAWVTNAEGQDARLPPEIMWRGNVYTSYVDKQWRTSPTSFRRSLRNWSKQPPLQSDQLLVRIEQELQTGASLFAPKPLYWAEVHVQGYEERYLPYDGRLVLGKVGDRSGGEPKDIRYSLIIGARQSLTHDPFELPPSARYLRMATRVPDHLGRMAELARRLTADLAPDRVDEKIRRLMTYLKVEGGFSYSLDIIPVDQGLDPVEDFLFERKSGHCEYFASSLALMLRAIGIPSRVVTGFKGASYNSAGGYYRVREYLAHSWVEAYIPELKSWRTLDPTPATGRDEILALQQSLLDPVIDFFAAAGRVWVSSIIQYSNQDQRRFTFEFLNTLGRDLFGFSEENAEPAMANVDETMPGFWWIPRWAIVLAFVGVPLLFLASWVAPSLWRRWRRYLGRSPRRRSLRPGQVLPLYGRWLRLLARQGERRQATQTHREFALDVSLRWQQDQELRPWADLPLAMVDRYYAVRHGHQSLEPSDAKDLEQRLAGFERQIKSRRRPSPATTLAGRET